jgi:hypothetical protein
MSDFSTSGYKNEQAPTTLQLCMGIVQNYEKGAFTKILAIKAIFTAFADSEAYESASQDEIDTATETYLAMLKQHDSM